MYREEDKQINCSFIFFLSILPSPISPSFFSFLSLSFWFFFHFIFPSFLLFILFSKVLQSNFSGYLSRVKNDSSLNLHCAFNSCPGCTGIYQKWNVLLYIMLNQLEVKELNHCIRESKILCFPIAFTLGGLTSNYQSDLQVMLTTLQ